MPQYLIERDLPGAGQLTGAELQSLSQKSCNILHDMGPGIQWLHSYVTADKLYCVYMADDADAIRSHAEQGGFPVSRIEEIRSVIGPDTAG